MRDIVRKLPNLPGVYRFYDGDGKILYVGKARDLRKRVSNYFQKSLPSPRIRLMVDKIAQLETTVTRSEADAFLLENNLIKSLQPRFNILFRDDKSYPYLKVTSEAWPRMVYYRGATDKNNSYFGPFPTAWAVRESIEILQKVFRLRTCENSVFANRTRPCLLHQIRQCSGPCVNLISQSDYLRDVQNAALFLRGERTAILQQLEATMLDLSARLEFEEAAVVRNQIQALSQMMHRQSMHAAEDLDLDVIAVAVKGMSVCVNLAMVRGGRHLGDRSFFPVNVPDALSEDAANAEAEILKTFLVQHYIDRGAPPTLILSVEPDERELVLSLIRQPDYDIRLVSRPQGISRQWLEMAQKGAEMALDRVLDQESEQQRKLEALVEALDMDVESLDALRIEAFDVSHMQGESTYASCVVFHRKSLQKREYRRYGINQITPGDDYAALRQALTRRYEKFSGSSSQMPDIVLIDGGKGQVEVAREVFSELGLGTACIVGVVKDQNRKTGSETLLFADGRLPLAPGARSAALMLLVQLRDEAHRFALTGMRASRDRKRRTSRLEEIEGVGPRRRQRLLARFGSMQGVADASVEDIMSVEGISRKLAQQIYQQLR